MKETSTPSIITDEGRAHKGYSQFRMAIQSNNQGVILRRRFDQMIANQMATVYVDGLLVGTWYRAGSNTFITGGIVTS